MKKALNLFVALTKVDEVKREVWGVATAEVVDKDAEMMDYASSKPYFEAWSKEFSDATNGKSLGNVREMHQSSAVGKLVALNCDDDAKAISVGAKIVDDRAWQKCAEGVYTGFSIGGRYIDYWPDKTPDGGEIYRFTAQPVEISVVDNPACPASHFTAVKADGTQELRKFRNQEESMSKGKKPTAEQQAQLMEAMKSAHEAMGKCFSRECDHDSMHECAKAMHKCHKDMGDAMTGLANDKQEPTKTADGDVSKEISTDPPSDDVTGEQMKPEQEQQLSKAASDSASALSKVEAIEKAQQAQAAKLEEVGNGVKELGEAFKSFVEGFGKAINPDPGKKVVRHTVGKESDAGNRDAAADKDKSSTDLMKEAHQHPSIGA